MSKTNISLYFSNPSTPDQKKYEVLRALFYERLPKKEVIDKNLEYLAQHNVTIADPGSVGGLILEEVKYEGPSGRWDYEVRLPNDESGWCALGGLEKITQK